MPQHQQDPQDPRERLKAMLARQAATPGDMRERLRIRADSGGFGTMDGGGEVGSSVPGIVREIPRIPALVTGAATKEGPLSSVGSAARSFFPSLGREALGVAQALSNPNDLLRAINGVVAGTLQKTSRGALRMLTPKSLEKHLPGPGPDEGYPDALKEDYAEAYGGWDKIRETFENDPARMLLDLSAILTLGGTAAVQGGRAASRVSTAAARRGAPAPGTAMVKWTQPPVQNPGTGLVRRPPTAPTAALATTTAARAPAAAPPVARAPFTRAAEAVQSGGRKAQELGNFLDPLNATVRRAKGLPEWVVNRAKQHNKLSLPGEVWGRILGIGSRPAPLAMRSGYMRRRGQKHESELFTRARQGKHQIEEIAEPIQAKLATWQDDIGKKFTADKAAVIEAAGNVPLNFTAIARGVNDVFKKYTYEGLDLSRDIQRVRGEIVREFEKRWPDAPDTPRIDPDISAATSLDHLRPVQPTWGAARRRGDPSSPETAAFRDFVGKHHSLKGMDALRERIGSMLKRLDPKTREYALTSDAYHVISDAVKEQAPGYAAVLNEYATASQRIKHATSTLNAGPRTDATQTYSRARQAMRPEEASGRAIKQALNELDLPGVEGLLAGDAMSPLLPRGLRAVMIGGGGMLTGGVLTGALNPASMFVVPGMMPRMVGKTLHGAGQGASIVEDVARKLPARAPRPLYYGEQMREAGRDAGRDSIRERLAKMIAGVP